MNTNVKFAPPEEIATSTEAAGAVDSAQVLPMELAQTQRFTPKDINAHLARTLAEYDELTQRFADNKVAIDAALAELKREGGEVSTQVLQLNAAVERQSTGLQALGTETQALLLRSHAEQDASIASLGARVDADVQHLRQGLYAVDDMLATQSSIVREQTLRLNQFDIAQELLDTATRGNRNRIEAVREELLKQQSITQAQVAGLDALQQAHYAEFVEVRQVLGLVQTQLQQLDATVQHLSADVGAHVVHTHTRFKRTHLALAAMLVLTATGFALVKWVPAFAPEQTIAATARLDSRLQGVEVQIADLPAMQSAEKVQGTQLAQLADSVATLTRKVRVLGDSVRDVQARVSSAAATPLLGSEWLMRQDAKGFTVQLMGAGSAQELDSYLAQNGANLNLQALFTTVTLPSGQSERHNLFLGVFASSEQARLAIEALPVALRASKPWVRQIGLVQATIR